MIIITGLAVTDFTLSRMAGPFPGSFVSTTTTPFSVINAAVFPPAPVIMYRLSFTFWISRVAGCCLAVAKQITPPITIPESTARRFIGASFLSGDIIYTESIGDKTIARRMINRGTCSRSGSAGRPLRPALAAVVASGNSYSANGKKRGSLADSKLNGLQQDFLGAFY
jgi:hypothetical protein